MPLAMLAFGSCQEEPVKAPAVNLNKETLEIGAGNETGSVLFQPTRDWSATVEDGADWLAVDPVSGPASPDAVVEVKVTVLANEGAERSAEIIFTAGNVDETLTVVQAANGSQGGGEDEDVITVADFLSKSVDTGVYYKLKGEITDLYNTEFGNFHLVDETGSVRVYGLTATKQPYGENDKSFSTLGLEEGDIVVIEGVRDEYNGEAQVGGAYYISHEEGQGGGDEPEPGDYTSIADVRKMAPASTDDKATVADGVKIKAYVISNVEINNLTSKKNVFVQDETAGLQIRFTSDATFAFGDEVVIDLSDQELSYYDGALQANNVPNSNVEVLSSDNKIDPKEVTVAEFMKNTYDAQYVALPDVQVVEADLGKTFVEGGAHTSINVEDKTGNSFVIFSSKYTTFGNEQVPQGAGVLKGISMINNGKMQISLTSQEDYAGMTGERFDGQGGDEPDPGEIEEVTIEEFLAKPEGETYYKLTGTVTNINNASWGNLTIEDETGDVYVYGVAKDEASVGGGPSFSGLGVEVGDTLTIAGKRASFNDSPQVGDAYYISHKKGDGGDEPEPPQPGGSITVEEFLSKPVDANVYYRLTGEITDLYNTEYGNFHLVDETGSVLVYGLTATKQSSNDKSFSSLGLKAGDIVTIEGTRAEFEGEAQVGGPAYYISHEEGEGLFVGDVEVELGANAYYQDAVVNGTDYKVLKLGASSKNGEASFTIPAGTTKMSFYCVAWNKETSSLKLSADCTITPSTISPAANSGAAGNPTYTMTVSDTDRYEFTVSGCNSDTVVNLESVEYRIILWDVRLD